MRPVFCGNFDHDTRQYDLERLFSKYGPISRIDMKIGTRSLLSTCLALKFSREGMLIIINANA
jgi:RNA recognition motif-containing protein